MNPYALRRQILSLVRLPISPPRPPGHVNGQTLGMPPSCLGSNRRLSKGAPQNPPPAFTSGSFRGVGLNLGADIRASAEVPPLPFTERHFSVLAGLFLP